MIKYLIISLMFLALPVIICPNEDIYDVFLQDDFSTSTQNFFSDDNFLQPHNFLVSRDADWAMFNADPYKSYDIMVTNQAPHCDAALYLYQSGQREWLRITGRGVHHYYIQGLWSFLKKRRRAMVHYFRVRSQSSTSWAGRPAVPAWLAALYCSTFLGPVYHAVLGMVRDRDVRWLWHVPTCLASLLGVFWGFQTYRSRRHRERLIAELQPKQTLKKPNR